jgi:hypothetical protein
LISKTKPQIITEAEKESPEQIIVDKSSPWSRTTSDTDTGGHVKKQKNRSVLLGLTFSEIFRGQEFII